MNKKLVGLFCLMTLLVATLPSSYAQIRPDSLDRMIGQMIIVGLNKYYSAENRDALQQSIKDGKISGIVLFEKDLQQKNTKNALAKLVWDLQENAEIPLFITIDEEGGRVTRLKSKYGFPKTVTAQYLGGLDEVDSTYWYAMQTASTLNRYGINVNFAPTVDLNINPSNPVIGGVQRSYSADHLEVVKHATAVIQAHDSMRVATVLKHFPGHGSSTSDTHLGIADVSHSWVIEELYPYKALIDSGLVDAIMSSHIVNRTLDERMLPATLSDQMIGGLLRGLLGYEGVIFSDDMHMGAISKHYGFEEAIVMAINAGVDVLIFSNNIFDDEQTTAMDLHGVIRSAVLDGRIKTETIIHSYERISELKRKIGLLDTNYKTELKNKLRIN